MTKYLEFSSTIDLGQYLKSKTLPDFFAVRDVATVRTFLEIILEISGKTIRELRDDKIRLIEINKRSENDFDYYFDHPYTTGRELFPHTDCSWIDSPLEWIGFYVLRNEDEDAGVLNVVECDALFRSLDKTTRDLLQQPVFHFAAGKHPIFDQVGSRRVIRFNRRELLRYMDEAKVDRLDRRWIAIGALEQAIREESEIQPRAYVEKTALFINNHRLLHGRTPLSENAARKLVRKRFNLNGHLF